MRLKLVPGRDHGLVIVRFPDDALVLLLPGELLADGDTVTLIKDLKLRGGSGVLKGGTKAKNIRLVDGDHEIDCRIDGTAMALKACFVKKG